MTEIRSVLACSVCRVHWYVDFEPAKCSDRDHRRQHFELHRHRSLVTLPDGTQMLAASFDPIDPYSREQVVDFGLYLDTSWAPPWPCEHVGWPDFGLPDDPAELLDALREFLDRAHEGRVVELGCLGGHGRTGTALACLVVLCGHRADDAVRWVRINYCPQAIETAEQENFVARLGASQHG